MLLKSGDIGYFIDATGTGAFYKDVGLIALILRTYTYETYEGNILKLADVLIDGKLLTYNVQFFIKIVYKDEMDKAGRHSHDKHSEQAKS